MTAPERPKPASAARPAAKRARTASKVPAKKPPPASNSVPGFAVFCLCVFACMAAGAGAITVMKPQLLSETLSRQERRLRAQEREAAARDAAVKAAAAAAQAEIDKKARAHLESCRDDYRDLQRREAAGIAWHLARRETDCGRATFHLRESLPRRDRVDGLHEAYSRLKTRCGKALALPELLNGRTLAEAKHVTCYSRLPEPAEPPATPDSPQEQAELPG